MHKCILGLLSRVWMRSKLFLNTSLKLLHFVERILKRSPVKTKRLKICETNYLCDARLILIVSFHNKYTLWNSLKMIRIAEIIYCKSVVSVNLMQQYLCCIFQVWRYSSGYSDGQNIWGDLLTLGCSCHRSSSSCYCLELRAHLPTKPTSGQED